jgi:hypothetical protein
MSAIGTELPMWDVGLSFLSGGTADSEQNALEPCCGARATQSNKIAPRSHFARLPAHGKHCCPRSETHHKDAQQFVGGAGLSQGRPNRVASGLSHGTLPLILGRRRRPRA